MLTGGSGHRGPGVRARDRGLWAHRWVDRGVRGEGVGCCKGICI